MTKINRVHAYLLIEVGLVDDNVDTQGYVPAEPPHVGTIAMREDFPGTGTHPFIFEDGPWKWLTSGVYLGPGEENAEGTVEFDYGMSRLIQLIAAGGEGENLARRMVHQFADEVKGKLDERRDDPGAAFIDRVSELERNFWKVRGA